MGFLGSPELLAIFVNFLVYTIITPLLLSIALRIFVYFAGIFGVPEALGRFAAPLVASFRAERAPDE
jgi:hypothetical protein